MIKQLAIALALALVSVSSVAGMEYRDAIDACSSEWRKRDDYKSNKGMAAWQAFRAECVVRQGWEPKKRKAEPKAAPQG